MNLTFRQACCRTQLLHKYFFNEISCTFLELGIVIKIDVIDFIIMNILEIDEMSEMFIYISQHKHFV